MKHILFVDDEPLVLRGLRRAFDDLDESWTVECASSGDEALQKLAAGPCDVLVTDMRMPGMNGAQLLAIVARRHAPVVRIVLSGQADHEMLVQCVSTAHHYFSKPCDPEQLRATVENLYALSKRAGQSSGCLQANRLPLLPSQPQVYRRLVDAIHQGKIDLETLGGLIEADQGLTAKVLKLSNSAYFGFGHTVSSAGAAIGLLGVELVKALVLSAEVFDFCQHPGRAGLCVERLWARAQALGVAARAIARAENLPREIQESAFTAGLLHNCGLLVLAANLPGPLSSAIARARQQQLPLEECERLAFGTTYGEVSAYVLGLWELPGAIIEAVGGHHAGPAGDGLELTLPALLHVAHVLVGERQPAVDGVPNALLNLPPASRLALEDHLPRWRTLLAELPHT
jgi:HD-like signal output (HDOD) protein/ActR/RegA family two-component response regulator